MTQPGASSPVRATNPPDREVHQSRRGERDTAREPTSGVVEHGFGLAHQIRRSPIGVARLGLIGVGHRRQPA